MTHAGELYFYYYYLFDLIWTKKIEKKEKILKRLAKLFSICTNKYK